MAGGMALVSILLALLIRPLLRGLVAALFPVIAVAVRWAAVPASNTGDRTPDVARTARATQALFRKAGGLAEIGVPVRIYVCLI